MVSRDKSICFHLRNKFLNKEATSSIIHIYKSMVITIIFRMKFLSQKHKNNRSLKTSIESIWSMVMNPLQVTNIITLLSVSEKNQNDVILDLLYWKTSSLQSLNIFLFTIYTRLRILTHFFSFANGIPVKDESDPSKRIIILLMKIDPDTGNHHLLPTLLHDYLRNIVRMAFCK